MEMIDIMRPNPDIILEDTTKIAIVCPVCGEREMVDIENFALTPLEIITGEIDNPGPCMDCQDQEYYTKKIKRGSHERN